MRPFGALLLAALAVGCRGAAPSAPAPALERADAKHVEPSPAPAFDAAAFRTAVDGGVQAYLAAHPTIATTVGEHRFDDAWPDLSAVAAARQAYDFRVRARDLRALASNVPETAGPEVAGTDRPRLDAAFLADMLEATAYEAVEVKPYERNPSAVLTVIGSGVNGLVAHPYAPKRDRLTALDARLQKVPALLGSARERVTAPLQAAMENAAIVGPAVAKMLRDELGKVDPAEIGGDAALADRLKKSSAAAAAAIDAYVADLAKSFPLKSLKNPPLGAEAWATLARLRDGVSESPAEVRKLGESELARLRAELDDLHRKNARDGETLRQFVDRLGRDLPKPDKVLEDYRAANKSVEEWLRGHPFVTVPWGQAKLEIVPTPPHMRGVSLASMNAAGALDAIRDARFEVNVPDAATPAERRDALLRFHAHGALELVSVHEALPGHYLQYLHARETPSLVRKVFWSATTGEGWAHYCEQAVVEEGYAMPDPVRARLFYLKMALQRAVRVIVDVGLNDGSLTLAQAAKLLEDNAFLPPSAAQIEARRGVVSPANMFSYTYGKLAILRLRERVKEREKGAFDLARFHDRLLAVGAVPVRYLGPAAFGLAEGT